MCMNTKNSNVRLSSVGMTGHRFDGERASSKLDNMYCTRHQRAALYTHQLQCFIPPPITDHWRVDILETEKGPHIRAAVTLWKPPSRHEQKTIDSETKKQKQI